MNPNDYRAYFTKELMMGPNTIRLLDEIMEKHPLPHTERILDLGCGTGLSSLYTAHAAEGTVFAVDLWCSATDNLRRIAGWNALDRIIPLHSDALDLPFADEYFDAVISIDAYHYFAGTPGYFRDKLLPLIKKGGAALIVVPGLKAEFTDSVPQEMLDWAGEEHILFRSIDWWKQTIGSDPRIASAEFFEMESGDEAWKDWFASEHKYALSDKAAFDKGVGKYMTFIGMAIRRAE